MGLAAERQGGLAAQASLYRVLVEPFLALAVSQIRPDGHKEDRHNSSGDNPGDGRNGERRIVIGTRIS